MSDHIERIKQEKEELDDKLKKLVNFKYTNMWDTLPSDECERMNTQGHIMCAYSAILGARIEAAEKNDS